MPPHIFPSPLLPVSTPPRLYSSPSLLAPGSSTPSPPIPTMTVSVPEAGEVESESESDFGIVSDHANAAKEGSSMLQVASSATTLKTYARVAANKDITEDDIKSDTKVLLSTDSLIYVSCDYPASS